MGTSAAYQQRRTGAGRSAAPGRAGGHASRGPQLQRIVDLQRDAGNAAVVQLLEENAPAPAGTADPAASEEAEDPAVVATAKAIFEAGARSYESGAFGRAYDEFSRSYELVPRPGIRFSMAQALRRLGGRREEAIDHYQAYLDSGETKRADECRRFIRELSTPASTGDLEADTTAGKGMFDTGARRYEAHDYAHAYDEFTRAWELTRRPQLLFSRAQALRRMGGRREEAIGLYKAYLQGGVGERMADATRFVAELSTPAATGDLEQDTAIGRGIFNKGAEYDEAGDFAHAYDEFTRSWELTERPQLLFSRAQALRRLGGRREEAIALYQEYLATGIGDRMADAEQHLAELAVPGGK